MACIVRVWNNSGYMAQTTCTCSCWRCHKESKYSEQTAPKPYGITQPEILFLYYGEDVHRENFTAFACSLSWQLPIWACNVLYIILAYEHCMQLNSTQVLHHSLQTTLKGDRTYVCCDILCLVTWCPATYSYGLAKCLVTEHLAIGSSEATATAALRVATQWSSATAPLKQHCTLW